MEGGSASIVQPELTCDSADLAQRFATFSRQVQPGLRRTLVAWYGPDVGADAAADAMGWAWEHFDRVERMGNPAGYLWRVGQTSARRRERHRGWPLPDEGLVAADERPRVEPALLDALAALSPRQRTAVLLVHGHGYSLADAAGRMDCRVRTLRNHLERGLDKLRSHLGVTDDA